VSEQQVKAAVDEAVEFRPSLRDRVRNVALNDRIKAFDKRRDILEMVSEALLDDGHLCRTSDERSFYFSKSARRLFDLQQREFGFLLSSASGLSATEGEFRFVLSMLQAKASQLQPTEVHTLARWAQQNAVLALSDGGPGVWVYQNQTWKQGLNGDDGLFFLNDADAVAFEPKFDARREELDCF
jgi:hypothetical protein